MKYRNIDILAFYDGFFQTKGLKQFIEHELRLKSFENKVGELALLSFLIDYIIDESPEIRGDETVSYGLWLLKLVIGDGNYQIYELDELFERWQEGADSAVYYMEQQKLVCKRESAPFSVPLFTQKIAISNGVLEGSQLQGIRYHEPEHMSGWYLTTSQYDGNIKNMKIETLQTIVKKRKDILQFLALPPGFVFEITESHTCRIWKVNPDVNEN